MTQFTNKTVLVRQIQAQAPVKHFGKPEEVASAVVYLASPNAALVVGTELIIDGGMSQL